MNPQVKTYLAAKRERAEVARANARARMMGRPDRVMPLPDLPSKPLKYVIEDSGGYVGTEWDSDFALDYAASNGCTVRVVAFDAE